MFVVQETQVLEAEQARLKDQIESFQKEKTELEFILETHRKHCGPSTVGNRTVVNMPTERTGPTAVTVSRASSVNMTSADTSLSAMSDSHFPGSGSVSDACVNGMTVNSSPVSVGVDTTQVTAALPSASVLVSHVIGAGCRPTSLPSLSTGRTVAVTPSTAGVNLLTMGLDSLADGHTGLTPLTGIPSGPVIVVGMPSSANTSEGSSVAFL